MFYGLSLTFRFTAMHFVVFSMKGKQTVLETERLSAAVTEPSSHVYRDKALDSILEYPSWWGEGGSGESQSFNWDFRVWSSETLFMALEQITDRLLQSKITASRLAHSNY